MRWYPNKDLAVLALCSDHGYTESDVVLLDCEQNNLKVACVGRPRSEESISASLMKNWISTCEQHHTEKCCVRIPPPEPLSWMIDTWSCCLVPAEGVTRYVALSYVWGKTRMFKATKETLCSLKENGALGTETHLSLPQVIRHTIALVPRLGERYLWVDSLCIMQDDAECLERHICHMASIYAAALFTIVAADGADADHGIPGIKGVSRARKLQPSLKLTSRLHLRQRDTVSIIHSPWAFRGWTLQEHVFSKRMLVFRHGCAQWLCQEHRCFEDIYQASPQTPKELLREFNILGEFDSFVNLALEYPMISQLERILQHYTSRRLTYENDVLRAISAVFTAHRKAFPSGFFWGLPLDFFDMALLWSNSHYSRRRQARLSSSPYLFPSWTWAGWVGSLRHGQWSSATYMKDVHEMHYAGSKDCLTIPMLEWHYRPYSDSSESPIPGQNSANNYKQRFMGKKGGLPHGWKYEREPGWSNSACNLWKVCGPKDRTCYPETPYYYSHEAAPGVKFWHPVPISPNPTSNAKVTIGSRLLYARTRRGRLWLISAEKHAASFHGWSFGHTAQMYVRLFSVELEVDIVLTNEKGELVGDLDINVRDDRDIVNNYECQPDEAGFPCELVAISKGHDFPYPMEPDYETYTF
ncbi:hypothetical protein LA080_013957 [Diaporthe eres]|nr:hypothetical protein LA080_013957 [Diaporthe eres]